MFIGVAEIIHFLVEPILLCCLFGSKCPQEKDKK